MRSRQTAAIHYAEMDSPAGPLVLCRSDRGLCHLDFGTYAERAEPLARWAERWLPEASWISEAERLDDVRNQLEQYFAGERRTFELELDLYGTPFQQKVWSALLRIPYGETRSYRDIAVMIGQPQAVRAVGGANNKNPISIIIPCHRVIGANGSLVGYGGGLPLKHTLLELEDVFWNCHWHKDVL